MNEINWSEFVREKIKERIYLTKPTERKIERFIKRYGNDLKKLWILHILSEGIPKKDAYNIAELIFGEEVDETVDNLEKEMEELNIRQIHKRLNEGSLVRDALQREINLMGIENIKRKVKNDIKNSSNEVKNGIILLCSYVEDNFDRDRCTINLDGFERTWKIYVGQNVDMNDLLSTGIVYKYFYSSNAYGYWTLRVPRYGLDILEEIYHGNGIKEVSYNKPSYSTVKNLLNNDDNREFIKWMEGSRKYVKEYEEEKELKREFDETNIDISIEDFKKIREDLIKKDVLVINYNPHRSNTGRRNSKPAKWRYEFTNSALTHIADILMEKFSEMEF